MNKEKLLKFLDNQITSTKRRIIEVNGDYEYEWDIHKSIDIELELERLKASKKTLENIKDIVENELI